MVRPRVLVALAAMRICGCTVRYTAPDVVPIEQLETYREKNAEVPVRVQVVNFVVTTVDIPKRFYELLGTSRTFSEVARAESPNRGVADYIVSGTYDFKENRVHAPYYHEINIKGTVHVRVVRARDNAVVLQKDYVEDRTDSASSFQPIRVQYLQEAFLRPISAEIKTSITQDVSAQGSK